jgi:aspartate racemase
MVSDSVEAAAFSPGRDCSTTPREAIMKTIGMLGGMSWESTVPYYRIINEQVRERLGGLHSAKIVLYSVDFEPMEMMQRSGEWEAAGEVLADAASAVERAGADFLVLCTNTMHKVAEAISRRSTIPLLHIAEPTARAVRERHIRRVALLGTSFTMEEGFYRERLEAEGLEVLVPNKPDREEIHRIIFEELCLGEIRAQSKESFREIIDRVASRGAEGVILGCTEIGFLIQPDDVTTPLFDTTSIHARAAADAALAPE